MLRYPWLEASSDYICTHSGLRGTTVRGSNLFLTRAQLGDHQSCIHISMMHDLIVTSVSVGAPIGMSWKHLLSHNPLSDVAELSRCRARPSTSTLDTGTKTLRPGNKLVRPKTGILGISEKQSCDLTNARHGWQEFRGSLE
jgi:hypothetical protein